MNLLSFQVNSTPVIQNITKPGRVEDLLKGNTKIRKPKKKGKTFKADLKKIMNSFPKSDKLQIGKQDSNEFDKEKLDVHSSTHHNDNSERINF